MLARKICARWQNVGGKICLAEGQQARSAFSLCNQAGAMQFCNYSSSSSSSSPSSLSSSSNALSASVSAPSLSLTSIPNLRRYNNAFISARHARHFASSSSTSSSSSSGGKSKSDSKETTNKSAASQIPDDFFDDEVESEKEFLDIATSLTLKGGLHNLTSVKQPITWDEVEGKGKEFEFTPNFTNKMMKIPLHEQIQIAEEADAEAQREEDLDLDWDPKELEFVEALTNQDFADHIEKYSPTPVYIPPSEALNHSMETRYKEEFEDPLMHKFIAETDPNRHRYDNQGSRHCPGKRQRQGPSSKLRCHLIVLEEVNHLDVLNLRRFMSEDGEILGKKLTGLCSKCQKKVAKTIKRARNYGLLPHLGGYVFSDVRPLHQEKHLHDPATVNITHVKSKTIL